jgi:hypothetical protein
LRWSQCCKHRHRKNIAEGPKTKISATSGKLSKTGVRMKNNVVKMKISENIADLDFEDNIANIAILCCKNENIGKYR